MDLRSFPTSYVKISHILDHPNEGRLSVIRCILTQSQEEVWCQTSIFQTYIWVGNQPCKIILDNGSYVNVISADFVSRLGLPTLEHPKPYLVSWVDNTSLPVINTCQVPILFSILS